MQHFRTHATAVSGLSFAAVLLIILVPILGLFVCRNRRATNNHRLFLGSLTNFNRSRTVCDLQRELTALQNKVSQLECDLATMSHVSVENRERTRRLESARSKRVATGAQGPLVAARFSSGAANASAPINDTPMVTLLPLTFNDPVKPST